MIDLNQALGKAAEAKKISLLSSRLLVEQVIKAQPTKAPSCCDVVGKIIAQLEGEAKGEAPNPLGTLGWVNLYVECLKKRPSQDCKCQEIIAGSADRTPTRSILQLLECADRNEALLGVILGQEQPANVDRWKARLDYWDTVFGGLTTSDGQTLIMHLLEAVLDPYVKNQSVQTRGVFNLLLAPAIRTVFKHPDAAHTAYTTYFQGFDQKGYKGPKAFQTLYFGDIAVLEEFQSSCPRERAEVLRQVRHATAQSLGSKALAATANSILHGREDETDVESPVQKMTQLSQLTCLIRTTSSLDDTVQPYQAYLENIHYRTVDVTPADVPPTFKWKPYTHEERDHFLVSVNSRYSAGYDVNDLYRMFSQVDLPVWVQDGEITFLWLLAAMHLSGDADKWISGELTSEVLLEHSVITHHPSDKPAMKLGASLADFVTGHAVLFDAETGKPLPKGWALISFLQRAVVTKAPEAYTDTNPLAILARKLYEQLRTEAVYDLPGFKNACRQIAQEIPPIDTIEAHCSLPTFLLEVILRDKRKAPYSLFFYPLTFNRLEEGGGRTIPGAFLAGTFVGLEWETYPSVRHRQNYHLFAALDAIRPIIDHELGLVLAAHTRDLAEEARNESVQRTVDAVMPALKKLTGVFRDATGLVSTIENAIDPEWSGLLAGRGGGLSNQVNALFTSGRIEINHARDTEPREIDVAHETSNVEDKAARLLSHRLTYLARASGYEGPPLSDDKGWTIGFGDLDLAHKHLFGAYPFLRGLASASVRGSRHKADPVCLNLLLKLLTSDAGDMEKGVHIVQVAATLGMAARRTRAATADHAMQARQPGADKLFARINLPNQPDPVRGASFSPLQPWGIAELARLVDRVEDVTSRGAPEAQVKRRVRLQNNMEAFRFLRALRRLVAEAFGRATEGVELIDWGIKQSAGVNPKLVVSLICKNVLPVSAKQSIWNFQQSDDQSYHNLRSNVRELCGGIGAFPSFVPSDLKNCPEPTDSHRFLIFEDTSGGNSHWKFLLG
jgi:hypothetical protein